MHLDDRISVEPGKPRKGDKVHVKYQGLLMQSGADTVWLHCGYDGWKNEQDINMYRNPEGNFACEIEAQGRNEINLCFKDSACNWDNNNGNDWICQMK